jgi:hypothetical protein
VKAPSQITGRGRGREAENEAGINDVHPIERSDMNFRAARHLYNPGTLSGCVWF